MKGFSFWHKWLVAVGLILVIFGVVMTLVSGLPVFDLFNRQIDPAFWGNGTADDTARLFQQWVYGILGATIAGWGIFLTFVARYPFARKEKWAWDCILSGLGVWYLLDTGLSALHQVYFNVAFNTVLFILALLPLFFTRKEFNVSRS